MSLPYLDQLPPLVPRRVLFGNPEKASPKVSPDGKMLAYAAPDNGVLNVYVRTLGQNDDRVITSDRIRGVRQFFWQPDSQHILYLQDQGGDENFHVYQTDLTTRETRDLTPFPEARAIPIALSSDFPDQMLVGLNQRNPQLHDVFRLNLTTGTAELDTTNPGDVAGWDADNALQIRAASSATADGGTLIRVRADNASDWQEFLSWGPDESMGGIAAFTPDNRSVYVLSSVGANASRLLQIALADKTQSVIVEDPRYEVSGIVAHPKTHALQAVSIERARTEWTVIDPSIADDIAALGSVRDGDFTVTSRSDDDGVWTVAYQVDDGPVAYYVYHRAEKRAELLFTNRPELEGYALAKMLPVSFPARDGLPLEGYLTLPTGIAPKNLPLVLLVHGGPWARDGWGFDGEAQWLANRGYGVLQINFRGSTGYGKAHLNAGDKEWAGKMHDDLLDGKAWAVSQGYADPAQVAIMGGSYGGYATLVGLAFTPDEFVCGVDIVGPSNLLTLLNSIPPYWKPMMAIMRKRLGDLETDKALLESASPLFKAGQIKAPLLIAQGANDPRVKQAESDQIAGAMRANGQPVEYICFPDEGHGFARPENNLRFFAAAEGFLARYLGGRAEPPTPEESVQEFLK